MAHEGAYDYRAEVLSPFAAYMTLAAAMVERAVEDVGTARRYIETNIDWREDSDVVTLGKRAWHWLTMPQDDGRISFQFLCDAMNVDLDHAQDILVDEVPSRIIDILERQIVQKVRKQQGPRKERKHAGSKQAGRRSNSDRRREGGRRSSRRRPGSAGR